MDAGTRSPAIDFQTLDIYGEPLQLADFRGKRVMLSFFRDAACPFCNLRLYELTQRYAGLQAAGLTVIAVFSSPAKDVLDFVARRPRPFFMVSDPDLEIYQQYDVQQSTTALFKALTLKLPRFIGGLATGGRPKPNPHVRLVPADFLIDESGAITASWYGRDTSDHMPLPQVQAFAEEGRKQNQEAMAANADAAEETRQALGRAEERISTLQNQNQALETRLREQQQKSDALQKILDAYKHGTARSETSASKAGPEQSSRRE